MCSWEELLNVFVQGMSIYNHAIGQNLLVLHVVHASIMGCTDKKRERKGV